MSTIAEWFSNPGLAAFAHWAVAGLALIISVIALLISRRAQRQQGVLQQQLLEIEQARDRSRQLEACKARLRAEIITVSLGMERQHRLEIRNDGEVEAREIKAWLEDIPIVNHPRILREATEITEIGPSSLARYILVKSFQNGPPWRFRVTWQDDSGTPGEYQTTLTI